MKKVMKVEGMSCGHCEKAVKNALLEYGEVKVVEVDLPSKIVTVEGDHLENNVLKEIIDEAGYQVVEITE